MERLYGSIASLRRHRCRLERLGEIILPHPLSEGEGRGGAVVGEKP